MTPQALEALILDGTPDGIATALKGLGEAERRKLSKSASSLFSQARRGKLEPGRAGLLGRLKSQLSWSRRADLLTNASMAMLGVCPLSQVKRVDWYRDYAHGASLVRILDDRRPDWVDAWLEHRMEQEFSGLQWRTVHALVVRGVCAKPKSQGYVALFASGFNEYNQRNADQYVPLSRNLVTHPSLLDDEVWRMFECDHPGFIHDWSAHSPHAPADYETWPDALAKLAAEGHLDRDRLLDASLSALWVSSNTSMLSSFCLVHNRLEPTDEELSAREAKYRELMSHRVAHVAGFGVKHLARIERAGGVDAAALQGAMAPIFALKQKSHPMAALRLLKRVSARGNGLDEAGALLAVDAMHHPAADVQELAVGLLESQADRLDAGIRERLAARTDDVAALVKPRFEALLGDAARAGDAGRDVDAAAGVETTRTEILTLTAALRARFGLDAPHERLFSTLPPPLPVDRLACGALDTLLPVEPIETVDALIDAVAHAIEEVDSADEIERIIDGISRLCDHRPQDFSQRAAPLITRIESSQGSETSNGLAGWGAPRPLRDLVLSWLKGSRHASRVPAHLILRGPVRFIHARLVDLAHRVARGQAAPLLSAPTHRGGWIAPAVLVERVIAVSQAGCTPAQSDTIQALLRLSSDGAADALARAREIEGPIANVLRFALGDARVSPGAGAAPKTWWVAAARSRWPRDDLSERLADLRLHLDWPDVLRAASYEWAVEEKTSRHFGRTHTRKRIAVKTEPALSGVSGEEPPEIAFSLGPVGYSVLTRPKWLLRSAAYRITRGARLATQRIRTGHVDLGVAFPTALHHQTGGAWWSQYGTQRPWLVEWQAQLWPHNLDGFFVRGVRAMVDRIDMNASTTDPTHAYLEPLFEAERPWTGMAVLALMVGIASKEADCRRLATDALIDGIEDGRAHPAPLAATINGLADQSWLKLNRLAESLSEVARVSPLHQLVVAQALEAFVAAREDLPRNLHHVLELLNELLVTLGRSLPPATRARLELVKGASKTAKLSKALLARSGAGLGEHEREAVVHALRTRMKRALAMAERGLA